MTKKFHVCDENCFHTTDEARELQLPTGSKIKSTRESANKAYEEAQERIKRTQEFKKARIITIENSFKSKILLSDIEEITNIVKECVNKKESEYEIHIIIQDALKKILGCKKDHGY